jgi:hypothetical protein
MWSMATTSRKLVLAAMLGVVPATVLGIYAAFGNVLEAAAIVMIGLAVSIAILLVIRHA